MGAGGGVTVCGGLASGTVSVDVLGAGVGVGDGAGAAVARGVGVLVVRGAGAAGGATRITRGSTIGVGLAVGATVGLGVARGLACVVGSLGSTGPTTAGASGVFSGSGRLHVWSDWACPAPAIMPVIMVEQSRTLTERKNMPRMVFIVSPLIWTIVNAVRR